MFTEQLPSGRWRGGFRVNGRKIQQTFDYEYEAEAWATAAEGRSLSAAAVGVGEPDPKPAAGARTLTVNEHGSRYLARRRGQLASATVKDYDGALRGIACTGIGARPIDSLKGSDVEQWITDQVNCETGAPTINRRLAMLRRVIRDAIKEHLAERDATFEIKGQRVDIRPDRTLDWLEDERLLAVADPHTAAAALLALDAGLRWGEMAGLGADCVRGDFISVRQVVEKDSGRFRRTTKNGDMRVVPMTTRLQVALAPLCAEAIAARGPRAIIFTAGEPRRKRTPVAHVTPGPDGSALLDHSNWFKQHFNPTRTLAGLDDPQPRYHDLRHTYGTRLAAAGVPRKEIAELMGHKDEQTTARYIHKGTDGRRRDLVLAALALPTG